MFSFLKTYPPFFEKPVNLIPNCFYFISLSPRIVNFRMSTRTLQESSEKKSEAALCSVLSGRLRLSSTLIFIPRLLWAIY